MNYLDKLSIQIGYKSYNNFLHGKYWQEFSFKNRKNICFCCQKEESGLHVHHITYVRLGSERYSDIITVCKLCHYLIHKLVRKKSIKLHEAHIRLRIFYIRAKFLKPKNNLRTCSRKISRI